MNKVAFTIIACLNLIFSYAQKTKLTEPQIDSMLLAAEKNLGIDNNETINQALKIYKGAASISYEKGILNSGKILMVFYFNKGNTTKSIQYGEKIERVAENLNNKVALAEIYNFRAMAFSRLGLFDECFKAFQKAVIITKSYKDKKNDMHYDLSRIYNNMVSSYYAAIEAPQDTIILYLKKSVHEAEQIDNSNKSIKIDIKYRTIAFNKMNIGLFYAGVYKPQRLDLANQYLKEALSIFNQYNTNNAKDKNDELVLLTSLSRVGLERKNYNEAISYAQKALKTENKIKSIENRQLALSILADTYREIKNTDSLNKYLTYYSYLTDSINKVKTLDTHKELQKINYKQNIVHSNNLKLVLISSALFLILTLLITVFYWKKYNKKLHGRYEKIIEGFKQQKQEINIQEDFKEKKQEIKIIKEGVFNQKVYKNSGISDETTNNLLEKLKEFERSEKYLLKDISLVYLANHFNTNTRYLSQIIKTQRGRSFNGYINVLRIKFIMEKLYNDPQFREYKISYLAEYCGYSSREVFFSAFKAEAGIPPSYFINQLKTDELPQD